MTSRAPAVEDGFVDVAGLETHVLEAGSGAGILLLHGAAPGVSARSSWTATLPLLAPTGRVIAPDLVGFGETAKPADFRYGIRGWVDHLFGLLDALGIEAVAAVGNSMGARVGLAMALAEPARVTKLVLMGTRVKASPTPASKLLMEYEPSIEAMEQIIRECFVEDQSLVTEEIVRQRYEASAPAEAQAAFKAAFSPAARANEPPMGEAEIGRLSTPALVLHGGRDRVVPVENSWDLFNWLPKADLEVAGDCGHWLHLERPRAFADGVRAFIEG